MNEEQILKQKIRMFFKDQTYIHIDMKNEMFKNGTIVELDSDDFFTFYDRYEGDIPIFYSEIKTVSKFKEGLKDGTTRT